jgi:hypothetical protein
MTPKEALALGIGAFLFAVAMLIFIGLVGVSSDASPRSSCECSELRAIRRILEQQFNVVCDERRCLPVPTPTGTPDGNDMP